MSLQSILDRTDDQIQAYVLTFPSEYCASVAMGCFVDDTRTVFCKDRSSTEGYWQTTASAFGRVISESVVAHCECISRPHLVDFKNACVGAKLWRLKEEQWENVRNEMENDDDDSSVPSAPSTKDCWLLEEAVRYYDPGNIIVASSSSVDASLRHKLRLASDRSPSKSLDLVDLFMLTEVSQQYVQPPHPEWPDYYLKHYIRDPELALTADETNALLQTKLCGEHVQMAMIYAIIAGLPDCHCGNMAVREVVVADKGGWALSITHFDTGVLSVRASVSLESLKIAYDDDDDGVDYNEDFDFVGGKHGQAYYYPILFTLQNAANQALHSRVRDLILHLVGAKFDDIAQKELNNTDLFDETLHDIGKIFNARVNSMKSYLRMHPNCSCKELAFATIGAWRRDFEINEEKEEFVRWLREVQQWAASNQPGPANSS